MVVDHVWRLRVRRMEYGLRLPWLLILLHCVLTVHLDGEVEAHLENEGLG